MEINKPYDLKNFGPNVVSRSSVSPADRRLFLAGALALTLATIPANVELAEASKSDLMTTHWFTACHAFANPTDGRHDEDSTAPRWARAHKFLAAHLQ